MLRIVFAFQLLLFSGIVIAQEKIEIERPVSVKLVPEKAKIFVCELFSEGKIKWIIEKSELGNKFEAKVKLGRERISVEFAANGNFEDAERSIAFETLDTAISDKINAQLTKDFYRFRIVKVQQHYSGNMEQISRLFKTGQADFSAIHQLFEMVVYGIKENEIGSFEYVFSKEGNFEKRLRNAEHNTDNLLF